VIFNCEGVAASGVDIKRHPLDEVVLTIEPGRQTMDSADIGRPVRRRSSQAQPPAPIGAVAELR